MESGVTTPPMARIGCLGSLSAGSRITWAIGLMSYLGAGPGLMMHLGALRRFTMAAGWWWVVSGGGIRERLWCGRSMRQHSSRLSEALSSVSAWRHGFRWRLARF